jgi:hypothetical protein
LAWNVLNWRSSQAKPRLPSGRRIYAIGDIHGRADLLSGLFARIEKRDQQPRPFKFCWEITSIVVQARVKSLTC